MLHNTIHIMVCGAWLVMSACAPQPGLAPASTDISIPPTATAIPPTISPTEISPDLLAEIDMTLGNLAKQNLFSGSVLIGRQGTILLSHGYGLADRQQKIPNTAQTRYRIASITKQFTAMAILILEFQGRLNVKDPICHYFVDCPAPWKSITIEHLLTHTSGIPNYTSLSDYRMTRATPSPPEETIGRFRNLPLDFQPGEKWSYSNSGYLLLGYIIEKVSGRSYEDFLQQAILTPLRLHDTGYDHNSSNLAIGYSNPFSELPADYIDMSIPYAAGALYSTTEDLYRWEQALSRGELIPQAYLDEMFAPHVNLPGDGGSAYGYGWGIGTERGRHINQHGGSIEGFKSLIVRYPNEQIAIIVLGNQENTDVGLIHDFLSKRIFGD